MRRVCLIFVLLAAAGRPVTAAQAPAVVNVGHRGASDLAPEHTFASYDLALELGADYIEQDLQMTSDGVLIVLHDDKLDRTARGSDEDCKGYAVTKTLAQIKTCDAGRWFNESYPERAKPEFEQGLRIPTLEEVFQRYGNSVNYYIETKTPQTPGMEEELLRLLRAYDLIRPASEGWRVIVQSFNPGSLIKIHALEPSLPAVQLIVGGGDAWRPLFPMIRQYAVGVGPTSDDATAEFIADAHAACLAVHPWTVNNSERMRALIDAGADGMFTNRPDLLDGVLGSAALDAGVAPARAAASYACPSIV